MHKISVIVPVYNSSKYLKDCLDSLINQTIDDLEIIAIDDKSTDNSLEILKSYQDKIKIYQNKTNLGQSKTRNIGIDIASGLYIGFVDSDDFIHPNMYKDLFENAINNNLPEILSTGLTFIKDNEHLKDDYSYIYKSTPKTFYLEKNPEYLFDASPSCCNKIFRKDILEKIKFPEVEKWEDFAFTYEALLLSNKIATSNEAHYFYRKHKNEGVSAKGYVINDNLLDIFKVSDSIEETAKNSDYYKKIKDYIKTLQIIICMERINEISFWDIASELKEKLIIYINTLIYQKYGDWKSIDLSLLSSKVGIYLTDLLGTMPILNENTKTIENQVKELIRVRKI